MSISKTELKKTMYGFNSEANAFLRAGFRDFDELLGRFLLFIESDKYIAALLRKYEAAVPAEFDATSQMLAAARMQSEFGPFSFQAEARAGEVYQILKAIQNREGLNVEGLFVLYTRGSKKFDDMVKNFVHIVAAKLIEVIEKDLTLMGIDMGLSDNISQTNHFNNQGPAAATIATTDATVTIDQSGVDSARLAEIVSAIQDSMDGLTATDKEAAQEYIDGVKNELLAPQPKKSVVNVLLNALKAINGTAQFAAAVTALVQFATPLLG